MARTATLSQLRTRILDVTDKREQRFSQSVLNTWINQAICEFEDAVLEVQDTYNLKSDTINIVSGTYDYSLPSDFYRLRGVDIYDGTYWYSMKPFNFDTRNDRQVTSGTSTDMVYLIYQNYIRLQPTPGYSRTNGLRVWYVPVHTDLSGDSDTYDGVNGWEDFVVYSVGLRIREAEEEDASLMASLLGQARARIQKAASYRDHCFLPTIKNVKNGYYPYPERLPYWR